MVNIAHKDITGANLHEPKGADAAAAGKVYVSNGSGSGAWASLVPPGVVWAYAGTSAPSLTLFSYGQAISRSTYALLFAAIGTTYGAGDGSTTFNVPDMRGRVPAGQDDMGGVSADRLTNPSSYTLGGLDGDTLGATGGSETHVLLTAQLAAHTHTDYYETAVVTAGRTGGGGSGTAYTVGSNTNSGSTGSNYPHNNVQPTIILNYIIFTGV